MTARKKTATEIQPATMVCSMFTSYSDNVYIRDMVLCDDIMKRLMRIVSEHEKSDLLCRAGLVPRRRILFVGPPGCGKTMAASALAGEVKIPLYVANAENIFDSHLGQSARNLSTAFDFGKSMNGVFFFDEFDSLGASRYARDDVGEMRRILNSLLKFIERDMGNNLIIAATNHPQSLDRALFRRFDEVITFDLPNPTVTRYLLQKHLTGFTTKRIDWPQVVDSCEKFSHADVVWAADAARKNAILSDRREITTDDLTLTIDERRTGAWFKFIGEE